MNNRGSLLIFFPQTSCYLRPNLYGAPLHPRFPKNMQHVSMSIAYCKHERYLTTITRTTDDHHDSGSIRIFVIYHSDR
jgi:hypothetical protein